MERSLNTVSFGPLPLGVSFATRETGILLLQNITMQSVNTIENHAKELLNVRPFDPIFWNNNNFFCFVLSFPVSKSIYCRFAFQYECGGTRTFFWISNAIATSKRYVRRQRCPLFVSLTPLSECKCCLFIATKNWLHWFANWLPSVRLNAQRKAEKKPVQAEKNTDWFVSSLALVRCFEWFRKSSQVDHQYAEHVDSTTKSKTSKRSIVKTNFVKRLAIKRRNKCKKI